MKVGVLILFLGLTVGISAQSWKDSLRAGNAHYQEQNYGQAYETLLEAQKNAPEDIDLSKDIGNAAYRNSDYETAEKAFRAAATSGENAIQQATQWHNVGNTQMQSKAYREAVESYKNALRLDPSNDKTRYNLAEAKRRLEVQEEQENNQQNQNDQQNQDSDDNQSQQDDHNDNSDSDTQQDNQQNSDDQNQQGNQSPQNNGENMPQESGKLSDRTTDRMLEELMKQEMETKRKMQGAQKGEKQNSVKSGKRW